MSAFAALVVCACGSGTECAAAGDCGPAGEALCLAGKCQMFSPDDFAAAVVDVSFPRNMLNVPKSGRIFFLHRTLADGGSIDCAALLASPQLLQDQRANRLQSEPRFLVFNCCGTFYPDNLVQYIRPADQALVYGEGYLSSDGSGTASAHGCAQDIVLSAGGQVDVLLPMNSVP